MALLARLCLTAALLPGAAALRGRLAQASSTGIPKVVKQKLGNMEDLQYWGDFELGSHPQSVRGIFDTGSFELVVFSKTCPTCGVAGTFDETASSTYQTGNLTMVHAYGSGKCTAADGFDSIGILGCKANHQPLWLARECQMPLLQKASFNAIVGIGPPGQPVLSAEAQLKQLQELENTFRRDNQTVPEDFEHLRAQTQKELEIAKSKPSLLENLQVTSFSTCLGKELGSPGWLIWHDKTRANEAGVQRIPVAGNITWGVEVTQVLFPRPGGTADALGCSDGCGAIVDTGTSLFAVPTTLYDSIAMAVRSTGLIDDCSDLSHYPDLEMTVGGSKLRFPPNAYIGSIFGEMDTHVRQYLRRDFLNTSHAMAPCQLLLMDLGPPEMTSLGPMMILGMPFFREYYTTFDLGTGRGHRSIYISEADDSCAPSVGRKVKEDRIRSRDAYRPRRVDASKIRVPHWLGSKRQFF